MNTEQDILKRLLISNKIGNKVPSLSTQDVVELALILIQKIKGVEKLIADGKIKGDKGDDAKDLIPDVDYLSKSTMKAILDASIESSVEKNQKMVNAVIKDFEKQAKKKMSELRDGLDAEITPELIEEITNNVYRMIDLPDIEKLLDGKNIKKIIESEGLSMGAVEGLEARLNELLQNIKSIKVTGGSTGGNKFRLESHLDVDTKDRSATNAYLKWNAVRKVYEHVEVQATGGGGGEMFIDQTPDNGSYDLLIGDVDGINTTFTVSQGEYPTGKLVVALNGQIMEQGATEDFVETSPGVGTFDFVVAPQVGDVITAFYSTATGGGGGSIDLEVEGTPNVDQTLLNLVAGTNMTITDNGDGSVTFDATGGGGASAFTDLTDVPSSYTSQALKVVRVNAGETALEFTTLAGGGDMLSTNNLSDLANTTTARQNLGVEIGVDVAPALGTDDNYVTDAEKTVIGNTSGTNTGDQDLSGLVPYTGATTDLDLGTQKIITPRLDGTVAGGLTLSSTGNPLSLITDTDVIIDTENTGNYARLRTQNLTGGVNLEFPDASGTFALTSDIPTDASASETDTGTSTAKYVSPDGLAGSNYGTRGFSILINDTTALTAGDGKAYFRIPEECNGFDLVGVRFARVSGTGIPLVQIHNVTQAVDMLTTRVSIDSGQTDSSTATTPVVIDTANDDVASSDRLRIDVDDAGTSTLWAEVQLVFRLP